MESKITISFDYEQKTPFIKIQHKHSDDERDRMVQKFLESQGGDICFAKFQYEESFDSNFVIAAIRPIPFVSLKEELKTMKAWVDHVEMDVLGEMEGSYAFVLNNSNAFRDWLKTEGIDHVYAESFTGISKKEDLFDIGIRWEKHRELNKPKKQL